MTVPIKVFDPRSAKLLAFNPLDSDPSKPYKFTRGITYVENQLFVGVKL